MDQWLRAGQEMLSLLLGSPSSDPEKRVIMVLSFLACVVALKLMCRAMGAANAFIGPSIVASFLGCILVLVCITAVKLYLPRAIYREHSMWILPAASTMLSLIAIVPLISGIMKTNYIGALVSWAVSIIVVAGVIFLAEAVSEAIDTGSKDAAKIRKRKDPLEEIFQQPK